jgi:MinD superfamily P-loop ATPase
MEVAGHFNIPVKLAVNKFDLNVEMTGKIEAFCAEQHVSVVGRIPFDRIVVQALVEGKNIIGYAPCPVADEVYKIWKALRDR